MIYLTLDDLLHQDPARAAPPRSGPCSVWVPSEQIACHLVEVPAVAPKKWRAMVPWILEERLLDKPDNLEFTCGTRDAAGRVAVLVVAKTVLAQWRRQVLSSQRFSSQRLSSQRLSSQRLASQRPHSQLQCRELIPDFFALPWHRGEVVVAQLGQRCLLRYGQWQGMAGPPDFIWPLVENLLRDSALSLRVFADGDAPPVPDSVPVSSPVGGARQLLQQSPGSSWLGLAVGADAGSARATWPPAGKLAAALAVLLPLLLVAGEAVETRRINSQALHFEQALAAGYRQYFALDYAFAPADFQRTVSRQLENRSAVDDGALALLEQLEPLLANCPQCSIDRLVVRDGQLQASLSGADLDEHLGPSLAMFDHQQVQLQASEAGWLLRIEGSERYE